MYQSFNDSMKVCSIYLIIRRCARTGAFPGAFCVPNSVALASPTLWGVQWMGHSLVPIRITARVIRRFQNYIFRRAMINMAESLRVHSLIGRAALHSRASAGCNFGQTAGPSLIKFGTREGRGGGRAGEGRGGDCPHFPQTRTFVTAEPSRTPASRVTG